MSMQRIVVQPDPRRKRVQLEVDWPGAAQISVEIEDLGVQVQGPPGALSINLPEFIAWTPATPQLYTLRCSAAGQAPQLRTFGMREVSVQEQRFSINQRPLLLKGIWHSSGAAAPTAYVAGILAGGFTWLRCDSSDPDLEGVLTAADSAGLLVSVALGTIGDEAAFVDRISGLHHHPSLIFWEVDGPETAIEVLRRIDPTRPILTNATARLHGRVFRPFHAEPDKLEAVEVESYPPVSRETETFVAQLGHSSAVNLVSLRGFDLGTGLAEKDAAALAAGSARICVEQLRANPRVAGYSVEHGLAVALAEAQAGVHAVISLARTNLRPREEVDVSVMLLNEAKLDGRGELSLQVVGPTNQTLWKKKRGVKIPKHGKELWTGTVAASGSVGPHKFVVQLWTDKGLAGEGQAPFFVTPQVDPWPGAVEVVDPANRWTQRLEVLARRLDPTAHVILVPPLADTIRAYPDVLGQVLGRVREGAAAIVFSPPDDWNDLNVSLGAPLEAELVSLLGRGGDPAGLVYGRLHPVLEGLPAGGPLGRPYRGVLNRWAIAGISEDDIATVTRAGSDGAASAAIIQVRQFGNGRVIFTTLRLWDRIGQDPVADRIFVNLLSYCERRAIASQGIARGEVKAVDWLRSERARLRAWRVIGPFPNADGAGHATAYPPEAGYEPEAAYKGLYRAVAWTLRHQRPGGPSILDLEASAAPHTFAARPLSGTYYAYAELTGDARCEPALSLQHTGAARCWVNGRVVYETAADDVGRDPGGRHEGNVVLKQGRNTLLVKISVVRVTPTIEVELRDTAEAGGWRWQ